MVVGTRVVLGLFEELGGIHGERSLWAQEGSHGMGSLFAFGGCHGDRSLGAHEGSHGICALHEFLGEIVVEGVSIVAGIDEDEVPDAWSIGLQEVVVGVRELSGSGTCVG